MRRHEVPILDYAPRRPARTRRLIMFAVGAILGEAAAIATLIVLRLGGPIFPFTLMFAPVALIAEEVSWYAAFTPIVLIGCPLLWGTYALVIRRSWRRRALAIFLHVGSFITVLISRDQL